MPSDDDLLEELAEHGDMDYAQWPGLLERILPRLDLIVYNMFPIPSIPLPEVPPSSTREGQSGHPSGENTPSPNSSKENIILETPPAGQSPRLRNLPMSPPPFRPVPDSSIAGPPGTLPPQLLSLLSSLRSTLKTSFSSAPPHTAQRLAELILRPTHHYRTLPSYLRALDRVLSVSSPASVFPLPPLGSSMATVNGRLLNGSSTPDPSDLSGSGDDFVGGAELTPIPWLNVSSMASYLSGERPYMSDLRTESTSLIDGPNGAGSLETVTVSVNGLSSRNRDDHHLASHASHAERMGTAGPLSSHPTHENVQHLNSPPHSRLHSNGTVPLRADDENSADMEEEEEEGAVEEHETTAAEEHPPPPQQQQQRVTARGPEVIGMEDIGPQGPNTQTFVVVDDSPRPEELTSSFVTGVASGSTPEGQRHPTQREDSPMPHLNPDPPHPDHDHDQDESMPIEPTEHSRPRPRPRFTGDEEEDEDGDEDGDEDEVMPDAVTSTAERDNENEGADQGDAQKHILPSPALS